MNFILFLLQGNLLASDSSAGSTGGMIQVGLLVLMVLVMYLLIIRPQQKRQKEVRRMLGELKKGDKIVTIGGIQGEVTEIYDTKVVVCIDSKTNTRVEFIKSSISEVRGEPEKEKKPKQQEIETKQIETKQDNA